MEEPELEEKSIITENDDDDGNINTDVSNPNVDMVKAGTPFEFGEKIKQDLGNRARECINDKKQEIGGFA